MRSSKTSRMVQIALLAAIEILLAFTPLGFIPLGVTKATTIHIPVILGGIILGPMAGGILGFVFGLTSIWVNTFSPTITSFVFSPFYSLGEFGGNAYSLIVALIPRILIGVFAAYSFRFILKLSKSKTAATVVAAAVGSMTNTILVMGGIILFFGEQYSAAKGMPVSELLTFIVGIISVNGVLEAIVAVVLVVAIAKPLLKATK